MYLSLTVYGGPDDGHYSTRIVGSLRHQSGEPFEWWLVAVDRRRTASRGSSSRTTPSPPSPATTASIPPAGGPTWHIECVDGEGDGILTDEGMARRLRARRQLGRGAGGDGAGPPPVVNDVAEPYPVPQQTFGWAAGDAAYCFGGFDLGPDEALVVRGRSPECAFWNLCLWTPYLHTYDDAYDRVAINGGQVRYEDDGSWEIVVAGRDPGHPNWISTQGHRSRPAVVPLVPPERTPDKPTCEVITLPAEAACATGQAPRRSSSRSPSSVAPVEGSWRDWNDTPASEPTSRIAGTVGVEPEAEPVSAIVLGWRRCEVRPCAPPTRPGRCDPPTNASQNRWTSATVV